MFVYASLYVSGKELALQCCTFHTLFELTNSVIVQRHLYISRFNVTIQSLGPHWIAYLPLSPVVAIYIYRILLTVNINCDTFVKNRII